MLEKSSKVWLVFAPDDSKMAYCRTVDGINDNGISDMAGLQHEIIAGIKGIIVIWG